MRTDTANDAPFTVPEIRHHVAWWPFTVRHTYNLIQRGELGAVKIGRRRLLTKALVEDFAKAHTSAPIANDQAVAK